MTNRISINKIVLQGSNFGPLLASNSVDKVGKEILINTEVPIKESEPTINESLLYYKDSVPIGPMEMVDDILTLSECGWMSVIMNSKINTKISMKKLRFNDTKCHKIHYGPESVLCPKLVVQGKEMKEVEMDDYLGDVVANQGNMKMNIKKRVSKGFGVISQVMTILEKLSLGSVSYTHLTLPTKA